VSQLKSWKLVETSDANEDITEEEEPEQIAEEADVGNTEQDVHPTKEETEEVR